MKNRRNESTPERDGTKAPERASPRRPALSLCDCRVIDPCGCAVDPCACFLTDERGCYLDCSCESPSEAWLEKGNYWPVFVRTSARERQWLVGVQAVETVLRRPPSRLGRRRQGETS